MIGQLQYYKLGRLPWIIPGAILYNVFQHKLAHAILTLGVLYATFYTLYYLIKNLFNSFTAILTTILLIFYQFLYGIGNLNYNTNMTIVYLLLSVFFNP